MITKWPKIKLRSVISAAVLFVLIGAIIALAVVYPRLRPEPNLSLVSVSLPKITTRLTSRQDGGDYTVQTLFTVHMDRETRKSVSNDMLNTALTDIMENMDVDQLARPAGVDYLNDRATEELNNYLDTYGVLHSRVFVTDFYLGDNYVLEDNSDQGRRDEIMGGLFQNTN